MIKFKRQKFSNAQQLQLIKSNILLKNKCNQLQEPFTKQSNKDSCMSSSNSVQRQSIDSHDDVPLFKEIQEKERHLKSQFQIYQPQKHSNRHKNILVSIIEQSNDYNREIRHKNPKLKTEISNNHPIKATNILQILQRKDNEQKQRNSIFNNDQNKNKNVSNHSNQKIDKLKPKIIVNNKSLPLKTKKQNQAHNVSCISTKKEYVRSERIKTQPNNDMHKNKKQSNELRFKINQIVIDQQAIQKRLGSKICESGKDTLECTFQPANFRNFMDQIRQNKYEKQRQVKSKSPLNVAIRNDEWLKRKDDKISQMRRQEELQRLKKQQFSHRPQIHPFKCQKANVQMSKFGQEGVQKYFDRLSHIKKKSSANTFKRQLKNHHQNSNISVLKQNKNLSNINVNDKSSKKSSKISYNEAIKNLNDRILKMKL